jgi:hypothetical protein
MLFWYWFFNSQPQHTDTHYSTSYWPSTTPRTPVTINYEYKSEPLTSNVDFFGSSDSGSGFSDFGSSNSDFYGTSDFGGGSSDFGGSSFSSDSNAGFYSSWEHIVNVRAVGWLYSMIGHIIEDYQQMS